MPGPDDADPMAYNTLALPTCSPPVKDHTRYLPRRQSPAPIIHPPEVAVTAPADPGFSRAGSTATTPASADALAAITATAGIAAATYATHAEAAATTSS